jgi:flavin reductase (DIM6/NTAB) family NADH-FMN oxidoreductase RutF
LECRLEREHKTGDHAILIGAVEALSVRDSEGAPLVFYGGRLFGLSAPAS